MSQDTSMIQTALNGAKDHMGSVIATITSLILAIVLAYSNAQRAAGVNDAKQADLERRVVLLEQDRATRTEVEAVNAQLNDFRTETRQRLDRIEGLLVRDLQRTSR